jgi:hypothetical protein
MRQPSKEINKDEFFYLVPISGFDVIIVKYLLVVVNAAAPAAGNARMDSKDSTK